MQIRKIIQHALVDCSASISLVITNRVGAELAAVPPDLIYVLEVFILL